MNAKACLKENKRIDKIIAKTRQQIEDYEHYLNTCKSVKEYRKIKREPFIDKAGQFFSKLAFPQFEGCLSAFFHYVYLFPLVAACAILFYILYGVCYLLGYPLIKQSEKKQNRKYKDEYEESIKTAKSQMLSLENNIKELKKERKEFNEKMGNPLAVLPNHWWDHIDSLIHYVKTGQAYSLDQALSFVSRDLREIHKMEQQEEDRRERAQQHKETQDALETIARNQERIAADIEQAEKERRERYRW